MHHLIRACFTFLIELLPWISQIILTDLKINKYLNQLKSRDSQFGHLW